MAVLVGQGNVLQNCPAGLGFPNGVWRHEANRRAVAWESVETTLGYPATVPGKPRQGIPETPGWYPSKPRWGIGARIVIAYGAILW